MNTLKIEPKSKNCIVIETFDDKTPTHAEEPQIKAKVHAIANGSLMIVLEFPQICDKRDEKDARNVIFADSDGSISAKQCIGEII